MGLLCLKQSGPWLAKKVKAWRQQRKIKTCLAAEAQRLGRFEPVVDVCAPAPEQNSDEINRLALAELKRVQGGAFHPQLDQLPVPVQIRARALAEMVRGVRCSGLLGQDIPGHVQTYVETVELQDLVRYATKCLKLRENMHQLIKAKHAAMAPAAFSNLEDQAVLDQPDQADTKYWDLTTARPVFKEDAFLADVDAWAHRWFDIVTTPKGEEVN